MPTLTPALQALLDLDIPDCSCRRRKIAKFCSILCPARDGRPAGCEQLALTGSCDCTPWYAPCGCVFRAEDAWWELHWNCLPLSETDAALTVAEAIGEHYDDDLAMQRVLLTWTRKLRNAVADVNDDNFHGQPKLLPRPMPKARARWKRPMVQQQASARVDIMLTRLAHGYHLWQPGDTWPNGLRGVRIDYSDVRDNGKIMQNGLMLDDASPELHPGRKKHKMDESPEADVPWTHPVWDQSLRQQLYRVRRVAARTQPSEDAA